MKLIYRAFNSNYEDLIRYYPRFYRDVDEMVAILKAHGQLADMMDDAIERVFDDAFISEADEETISELETLLGIPYSNIAGKTLEERRALVKSIFIGSGKLSASMLIEMIKAYTEADVDIEFTDYIDSSLTAQHLLDGSCLLDGSQILDGTSSVTGGTDQALYITIIREGTQNINVSDILLLLQRVIPAHLVYFVSDTLNTILDCTDIEHVYLTALRIAMHIPEMECIEYGCIPGLEYNDNRMSEEEDVRVVRVEHTGAAVQLDEDYEASMTIAQRIDMWGTDYLDGSALLDGSLTLDAARYGMDISLSMTSGIQNGEESISGEVILTHNLWYLDGSLKLDGGITLDSTYEKEVL